MLLCSNLQQQTTKYDNAFLIKNKQEIKIIIAINTTTIIMKS